MIHAGSSAGRGLTHWLAEKAYHMVAVLYYTLFFTFLTSYVLFSGKIRACGCLAIASPLTLIQPFTKDVILTRQAISANVSTKTATQTGNYEQNNVLHQHISYKLHGLYIFLFRNRIV